MRSAAAHNAHTHSMPARAGRSRSPTHLHNPPQKTKISKKDPSDLEKNIVKILSELEHANGGALKAELKGLYIVMAKEVDVDATHKAVLVFVPPPKLAQFHKVQKTLVEELEKKLSGQHVLILANRTMVSPQTYSRSEKYTGVRPRSRSLKNVQEAILDDLVYPTDITGKRIRIKTDGSRLLRVHLNPKDQAHVEGKIETFRSVYKRITSKVRRRALRVHSSSSSFPHPPRSSSPRRTSPSSLHINPEKRQKIFTTIPGMYALAGPGAARETEKTVASLTSPRPSCRAPSAPPRAPQSALAARPALPGGVSAGLPLPRQPLARLPVPAHRCQTGGGSGRRRRGP